MRARTLFTGLCLGIAVGVYAVSAHATSTGYLYAHFASCTPMSTTTISVNNGPWSAVQWAGVYNLHVDTNPGRFGDYTADGEATALVNSVIASQFDHDPGAGTSWAVTVPAFCIETGQRAPNNELWNRYEIGPVTDSPLGVGTPMAPQAASNLRKLWGHYGRTFQTGTQAERELAAGAFQTSVWEILNESSGTLDLASGSFRISNGSIVSLANSWLASLPALPEPNVRLRSLTNPTFQDFGVLLPEDPPQAPEPLTFVLAAGLAALVTYTRRRNRASA